MITFCFDRVADDYTGYPNLARWQAEPYTQQWRQYDQHWPYSVPCRLLMYFRYRQVAYQVCDIGHAESAYYPIAFGWFDFSCDYIELLDDCVKSKCKSGSIKLLFYYHEGDNPERIQRRLSDLVSTHCLPQDCFVFISANTAADYLENCLYFNDHECFFRHLNRNQLSDIKIKKNRKYDFTLLSRTHKWWRASVVSDLYHSGVLDHSLWSYNTAVNLNEDPADNPLELDSVSSWRNSVTEFVDAGPYTCDQFDCQQQNDHHSVNTDLYTESNMQIVLETHFDADQSKGTFITEKTYKPIKYGQPFVIVGPAGTLAELRKQGYSVFDSVIDNSYDLIENNTARWQAIKRSIVKLHSLGTEIAFNKSIDEVAHNQIIFHHRSDTILNTIKRKLSCLIK